MASIVQHNKSSISSSQQTIAKKDKKLNKPKRNPSSNLNFENELNLTKKVLNNIITKNSIIQTTNSKHSKQQSINNLFKLTSPTSPPPGVNNSLSKHNSIIYIHSNESSSDSETESISNSVRESISISSIISTTSSTTSPRNSSKSSYNININSILKDIKSFNFKYRIREKDIQQPQPQQQNQKEQNQKENIKTNLNQEKVNSLKNKKDPMESSTETLVASSNDSIHSVTSSLATLSLKDLALLPPTPPPKTKLPDIPKTTSPLTPPPRPAPKYLPPPIPLSKEDVNLESFEIIKTIGTGSFGRVHLVKSKANDKYYAMKAIPKRHIVKEQHIGHIKEEKKILSELHHPLFIQLYGTFHTRTHLFIITNFVAGGELFAILKKKSRFTNSVARFYAAEVTVALEYLHSKDIIYRDLKPENVMVDVTGHIRIVDFGFAKYVPDVTYTLCGTPEYMAPEVILCKAYSKAVDWYALGILIFEMLCGYPPFYDQDQLQLYKKILSGKIYWPSYITEDAKHLIKQLITTDITKRYGNLKNGSADIKNHLWFAGVDWNKVEKLSVHPPYIPEIFNDGDTRHFQRYSEPCDKEYYESQDQEALLDGTNDYDEYFKGL